MKIADICNALEAFAPLHLQEDYDNSGLTIGDKTADCTGAICTLDVTEKVLDEAVSNNCNLVVAHHPVIFRGLKKLTGSNEVERIVIKAIQKNIAIYSAHTNVDNVAEGVNDMIAGKLNMVDRRVLKPKTGLLLKLYTFVPADHLDKVRNALFAAGAGTISRYSECSFTHQGVGTFMPGEGTDPFSGSIGTRQQEQEIKLEVILPVEARSRVLKALFESHPYEEVAYDLVALANEHQGRGSGIIGNIVPTEERAFLEMLHLFNPDLVRHTAFINRPIRRVAVCGGAGSFLVSEALKAGADAFITADLKYHEFFGAEGKMLLCDIGHFESEQFTMNLFVDILERKFPNFAVRKSEIKTNPVYYFTGK